MISTDDDGHGTGGCDLLHLLEDHGVTPIEPGRHDISVSGVDHVEDNLLTAVYDLHATQEPDDPDGVWTVGNEIAIKVRVDRDNPHSSAMSGHFRITH